jgi:lysophospholipase L1-like esterase
MKFLVLWMIATLTFTVATSMSIAASKDGVELLTNGGFQSGLRGWTAGGQVALGSTVESSALPIRLGPPAAAIRQRLTVSGGEVLFACVMIHADPSVAGELHIRCYNDAGGVVLDVASQVDQLAQDSSGHLYSIYFKTQQTTTSLEMAIERTSGRAGAFQCGNATLLSYPVVHHDTQVDLDKALRPCWLGNEVYNETILLESDHGGPASGKLLFPPSKILSVRDYSLKTTFKEGVDYAVDGSTISAIRGSSISTVSNSEFPTTSLPWLSLQGRQVVVSYSHTGSWNGPVPIYEGALLPRIIDKLRHRKPVTVVAYGDSITFGNDTSSSLSISPYEPTWADMLQYRLRRIYNDSQMNVINVGLGGATATWADDNASQLVATLRPDLVLIAFGMNDFWGETPAQFGALIKSTIAKIRAQNPDCEYILISSIAFDPAYSSDPTYVGNLAGYPAQLASLAAPGVATLDMYHISQALYIAKKPKDVLGDPMHPNDYFARWFAQGLAIMLGDKGKH